MTRFKRSSVTACAAAMSAAFMVTTPMWAYADGMSAHDTKPMPSGSMDNSKGGMKMDGMKGMEGMSMTGDVDYDFAANMRMHHMKALEMSQAQIKSGKNPQMVQMAKDITAAQKKEIATFDQWLGAHKKGMPDAMSSK